jgi:hypothetical protein
LFVRARGRDGYPKNRTEELMTNERVIAHTDAWTLNLAKICRARIFLFGATSPVVVELLSHMTEL